MNDYTRPPRPAILCVCVCNDGDVVESFKKYMHKLPPPPFHSASLSSPSTPLIYCSLFITSTLTLTHTPRAFHSPSFPPLPFQSSTCFSLSSLSFFFSFIPNPSLPFYSSNYSSLSFIFLFSCYSSSFLASFRN